MKERAAAGLASGQPLTGDDWSLRPAELTLRQGRTLVAVPFREIDKVGLFDDKLCIWCKGQDEPAARIAPGSRNAPVLGAHCWANGWRTVRRLRPRKSRPTARRGRPRPRRKARAWARLIFERRKRKMAVYLGLAALIVFLPGFGLIVSGDNRIACGIAGGLVMVVFAGLVYAAWGWSRFILRCHERGLYRKWGRSELRFPYTEITQFTYSATRHFHNGAYTGTRFSLKCTAPQGTIGYSAMINSPDAELDNLRDFIAKIIAARMIGQLRAGDRVEWTTDMTFSREGLVFRRAATFGFGRKPLELLPYNQIRGVDMQAGFFYLWNQTEPKPIITKPVSTPNFFPGFYVILSVLQGSPADGASGEQVADS